MIQQPLDLAFSRPLSFDDFIVGENEALLARLKNLENDPPQTGLYLAGPKGSGKTLLLQILKAYHQDKVFCLDPLESWLAEHGELAVFALFNQLIDLGICPIFASEKLPDQWGLTLPDLKSRLLWGSVYQVQPLDEKFYPEVLQKAAARAGMSLPPDVAHFLYTRMLRDLSALPSLIAILSQASLESKRRLTVPFVKEVLGV